MTRHESKAFQIFVRAREVVVGSLKIGVQLGQTLRRPHPPGDIPRNFRSADDSAQSVVEGRNGERYMDQFAGTCAPDGFEVIDSFSVADASEDALHLIGSAKRGKSRNRTADNFLGGIPEYAL